MKFLDKIRIGIYHAKYHRSVSAAEIARDEKDIQTFKKYIYRAEGAWKKIIIITKKYKDIDE